jgi:hypothetical protein
MLGVPLSMADHKKLLDVLQYIATGAKDPNAELQFEVSAPDRDGNCKVSIKVESRIPQGAARAVLTQWEGKGTLYGYGSIKVAD